MKEREKYQQNSNILKSKRNEAAIKRNDIAEIERAISATTAQLNSLESDLLSAPKKLADGSLTTEVFLSLKDNITAARATLTGYKEVLAVQKNVLSKLEDSINLARANNAAVKRNFANELASELAAEAKGLAGEQLKNLIYAALVATTPNEDISDSYRKIGRFLCHEIFSENPKVEKLPSVFEANRQFDLIIATE